VPAQPPASRANHGDHKGTTQPTRSICQGHTAAVHQDANQHASDIVQVPSESAKECTRVGKVDEHSMDLDRGCESLGLLLDGPCTNVKHSNLAMDAAEHMPQHISLPHLTGQQPHAIPNVEILQTKDHNKVSVTHCDNGFLSVRKQSRPPNESAREACSNTIVTDPRSRGSSSPLAHQQSLNDEAVASGKYSEDRYSEFTKHLENDMHIRLQAGMDRGNLAAGVFPSALLSYTCHTQRRQ